MLKYYNSKTKTIIIPYDFNEELIDLPKDTKTIIFYEEYILDIFSHFNKPLTNLPESLTHLTFGFNFNQPVVNLPKSLIHLTFGYCFNQSVDCLPSRLTHLTFGCSFNQLVNCLPENLTHLTFNWQFKQNASNLPAGLQEIKIYRKQEQFIKIPFGCKVMFLDRN